MTTPAETVTEFLRAFMSGDSDRAWHMATDDFHFRASQHEDEGDKNAYFAGSREKAKFIDHFRILRQWEDGDQVSTIYELSIRTPEGRGSMTLSEWHTVRDEQVASTFMVFNAKAKAVSLMGRALAGHRH